MLELVFSVYFIHDAYWRQLEEYRWHCTLLRCLPEGTGPTGPLPRPGFSSLIVRGCPLPRPGFNSLIIKEVAAVVHGCPGFMFSYGEVFLTLAAAVALFGPKDIPIVARAAGRFVGRAVGFIQSARGQLDDVMKRSQVDQVHKELRETMAQLEAIQYEIRSGMSISNPGPMTRSILNIDIKPESPASSTIQAQAVVAGVKDTPDSQSSNKFSETQRSPVSETQVVLKMQELHRTSSHTEVPQFWTDDSETISMTTARIKPVGFQPGPDGTFDTMPPSTERASVRRQFAVKPIAVPPATPQLSLNTKEVMQDISVLPISAVSAGLVQPRTGPVSGGADLVLEFVTERKVAFDSKEFFQQSHPTLK